MVICSLAHLIRLTFVCFLYLVLQAGAYLEIRYVVMLPSENDVQFARRLQDVAPDPPPNQNPAADLAADQNADGNPPANQDEGADPLPDQGAAGDAPPPPVSDCFMDCQFG